MVLKVFRSALSGRGQDVVLVTGRYRGTTRGKLNIHASLSSKILRNSGVGAVRLALSTLGHSAANGTLVSA